MKSKHNGSGDGHVTETPDVSHIRNEDVTHEASDVYVRGVATFLLALTVLTIAVYLLMWGMFRIMYAQETKKDEPASPMAMSEHERMPPEPRLQSAPGFGEELGKQIEKKEGETGGQPAPPRPRDPRWENRVLRQHWKEILQNGEKDPSGKMIVLPIEEAKKQLLAKGLPTR